MMLAELSIVTGLELSQVVYLPIGILLVPFVYFVVVKSLLRSEIAALAIMIYAMTHIAQTGWYNVFAYVWARPLYLLSLMLLFWIGFKLKDWRYYQLLGLFFVALVTLHYTPPGWIIILATVFVIVAFYDQTRRYSPLIVVLFTGLYLWLVRVVYRTFIPLLAAEVSRGEGESDNINPIANLINSIRSMLGGSPTPPSEYIFFPATPLYSRLRLALNALFALFLALGAIGILRKLIREWRQELTYEEYLLIGIGITFVIHAFVYGVVFSFSTQVLIFLGPVIGILALRRFDCSKQTEHVFLMLVLAIALPALILRLGQLNGNLLQFDYIMPGAEWFTRNSPGTANSPADVTGGLHIHPYYSLAAGEVNAYNPVYITPELYEGIVANGSIAGETDYLVVDPLGREKYIQGTRITLHYEPLGKHSEAVSNNYELEKVYGDGMTEIYEVNEE